MTAALQAAYNGEAQWMRKRFANELAAGIRDPDLDGAAAAVVVDGIDTSGLSGKEREAFDKMRAEGKVAGLLMGAADEASRQRLRNREGLHDQRDVFWAMTEREYTSAVQEVEAEAAAAEQEAAAAIAAAEAEARAAEEAAAATLQLEASAAATAEDKARAEAILTGIRDAAVASAATAAASVEEVRSLRQTIALNERMHRAKAQIQAINKTAKARRPAGSEERVARLKAEIIQSQGLLDQLSGVAAAPLTDAALNEMLGYDDADASFPGSPSGTPAGPAGASPTSPPPVSPPPPKGKGTGK